jgi:4-hydroxybenzoate polyprenyltransferase
MGACRMLNVMLGMNVIDAPIDVECWLVAGGLGIYVTGVTWFARKEADESSPMQLGLATLVMVFGVGTMASFVKWSDRTIDQVSLDPQRWYWLVGILGLLSVWRCFLAVAYPIPIRVRIAVAQCVLSIIMLDAVTCYAVRGVPWAVAIMLLVMPAMFLGRWIKIT